MKWIALALVLVVALLVWRVLRPTVRVKLGESAPEFQLPDQQGQPHQLKNYRGQWVVLFFYPRDDTPGCTREACQFRDDIQQLNALQTKLIGISVDTTEMHARFAAKFGLPFTLLADTEGLVAARYGALIKFGPWKIARRMSFIIAPNGRIAHLFSYVIPAHHAAEVIHVLKQLQTGTTPR